MEKPENTVETATNDKRDAFKVALDELLAVLIFKDAVREAFEKGEKENGGTTTTGQ